MADIELVIKIPEEDYETLINTNDSHTPSMIARRNLYKALKNGTPLPKGHGDLKDADALIKHIKNLPKCPNGHSQVYDEAMIINMIEDKPTIIEANKGEETQEC